MQYANITDVEARTTRTFTPEEEAVIQALLQDAAVMIDATGTKADEDAKCVVSCRMVIRAMGDGASLVPVGATQGSMSGLGYSQSWTFSGGANGELYLTRAEKSMLGIGNAIGSRSPVEEMAVTDA